VTLIDTLSSIFSFSCNILMQAADLKKQQRAGSTSSVLEDKMQRINSTINFSHPHPSDRE
jgi:hypothetical protein